MEQHLGQRQHFSRCSLRIILDKELNSRQHLVVARAGCVDFLARITELFGQVKLDFRVHILKFQLNLKLARRNLRQQFV